MSVCAAESVNSQVCPEPVIKTLPPERIRSKKSCCRVSCPAPINDAVIDCREIVNNVAKWCQRKYSQHRLFFMILPKLLSLILYVFGLGTDIFTAVQHLSDGHIWWGSLTIVFSVLPMLSLSLMLILHASQIGGGGGESAGIKCLPSMAAIACSPMVPFGWMVLDIISTINAPLPAEDAKSTAAEDATVTADEDANVIVSEDANITIAEDDDLCADENTNVTAADDATVTSAEDANLPKSEDANITVAEDDNLTATEDANLTAAESARLIKLFVTVVQSYPQAALQIFIVFRKWVMEEDVRISQWLSISTSLASLSFAVSTGYLNQFAAGSSKVVFLIFGLLAIGSRLVVCCVYCMVDPPLWLVPFCTFLTASTIVWIVSFMCQRVDDTHVIGTQGKCAGVFIFVLTEGYNSFTMSGLLISGISLGFAVGGNYLNQLQGKKTNVDPYVAMVATILAAVSTTFNVMFTAIPKFKGIRKDWMRKSKVEELHIE